MRHLDALYAHIQQPEDKGRIKPRRAYDRRNPHAFSCHHRELHIVKVEAGVLHVYEGRIETGEPDQLDDLRVGDAADMGPQSEAAFAQNALDPILFHIPVSSLFASGARPPEQTARAAGWR